MIGACAHGGKQRDSFLQQRGDFVVHTQQEALCLTPVKRAARNTTETVVDPEQPTDRCGRSDSAGAGVVQVGVPLDDTARLFGPASAG